ncbi:hypothetical protein E5288_WYG010139 [Bos mutus]|uniref:Uncharacterized protein n=1 Tax=Bos mutus TaxID=72004 RepID=A0A6B0R6M4_9CETA|nr:hypothetical protein [Bos mutus]
MEDDEWAWGRMWGRNYSANSSVNQNIPWERWQGIRYCWLHSLSSQPVSKAKLCGVLPNIHNHIVDGWMVFQPRVTGFRLSLGVLALLTVLGAVGILNSFLDEYLDIDIAKKLRHF